jgi:phosphotransferase system enzyme I (PtsI)
MQYTLAMDRICPDSETVFQLYHPSILRLIQKVVLAADQEGIEVSVCGEAASCEHYTKLLVGLGVRNFSCSMRYVSKIRRKLTEIDTKEAKELGDKALSLASIEDIRELIYSENAILI